MTMSGNATNQELRYVARMAHTQICPALRCESLGYERDQFATITLLPFHLDDEDAFRKSGIGGLGTSNAQGGVRPSGLANLFRVLVL